MCTLTLCLCLVNGACVRKNRVCLWLALGCVVLQYPYQSNPKKTLELATRVGYGERSGSLEPFRPDTEGGFTGYMEPLHFRASVFS